MKKCFLLSLPLFVLALASCSSTAETAVTFNEVATALSNVKTFGENSVGGYNFSKFEMEIQDKANGDSMKTKASTVFITNSVDFSITASVDESISVPGATVDTTVKMQMTGLKQENAIYTYLKSNELELKYKAEYSGLDIEGGPDVGFEFSKIINLDGFILDVIEKIKTDYPECKYNQIVTNNLVSYRISGDKSFLQFDTVKEGEIVYFNGLSFFLDDVATSSSSSGIFKISQLGDYSIKAPDDASSYQPLAS